MFTAALLHHDASEGSREALRLAERGQIQAVLDPLVLHELSYVLLRPQFAPQGEPPRTRGQVARHLLAIVAWSGVQMDDKSVAAQALSAWEATEGASFVDCYLQARTQAAGERVCTDSRRHFPSSVHPEELVGMSRQGQRRSRRRPRR